MELAARRGAWWEAPTLRGRLQEQGKNPLPRQDAACEQEKDRRRLSNTDLPFYQEANQAKAVMRAAICVQSLMKRFADRQGADQQNAKGQEQSEGRLGVPVDFQRAKLALLLDGVNEPHKSAGCKPPLSRQWLWMWPGCSVSRSWKYASRATALRRRPSRLRCEKTFPDGRRAAR